MTRECAPGADAIRAGALAALTESSDPRARELLETGDLVVDEDVDAWETERGPTRAHDVTLRVTARLMGTLHASPALHDALTAALAAALASTGGHALRALRAAWDGRTESEPTTPYRGATLRTAAGVETARCVALEQYLRAAGHAALAERLERASLREHPRRPGTLLLTLTPVSLRALRADRMALETLGDAARELFPGATVRLLEG